jgi:lysophospholipase L1-like esterase
MGPAHGRVASPWGRRITGAAVTVIVAALGLVVVAAVRDGDVGEPVLSPARVVVEAPTTPDVTPPTPTPTPEAIAVTAPPSADPTGDSLVADATEVVLVGDSLAEGSAPALGAILEAAGVPLRADTRTGRGTAEGARALAAMAVQPGAVVVVILGTNDGDDRADAVRNVQAVLGSVPEGTPIRWIDVARAESTVVNEVIAAVAAIDPETEVLAWSAVVADNPELLVADGIHFTAEGYATLAAFIATEALGLELSAS